MKKKLSLIILFSVLFALLLTLSSCFLLPGEEPTEPTDPSQGGTTPPGGGGGPEEPEEPDDELPEIDLTGISLTPYEGVYDARPHSLSIEGALPEGVTVAYEGNGVKDAGEHTVTVKFYFDGEYLAGKDMTSTIKITRATYDMGGVSFDGMTVIADGQQHSLAVTGTLPKGVSVSYVGNAKSEAGEHSVRAVFSGDANNYEPISDMSAVMRIAEGPSAFAGLYLPDLTVEYDGYAHSITLGGNLPSGVSVSYSNCSATNAGEYVASAALTNGTDSFTLTSKLSVKPAWIDVSAKDKTVTYNGNNHSITLSWGAGTRPYGVSYVAVGNNTAAIGVHNVRFRFTVSEEMRGNYLYHPDINVTLTVLAPESVDVDTGLVFASKNGAWSVTGYTGSATKVVIPETYTNSLGVTATVRYIASGAFSGNKALTYVGIPNSVRTIGNSAFRGCTSLGAVTIPSSLQVLGALAFAETSLTDVALPDTLQAIGQGAFRDTDMVRITLPFIGGSRITSNPYIGYIFGASAYAANDIYLPDTLKTVILSDDCELVPAYSFYGATSIEEVIIGKDVSEIGISAFAGCTSMIGIYIPATVTDIPAAAHLYNSPVYGCSKGFVIGTNVADKNSKPEGWASRYDILSDTERAVTEYGISYEEYLESVRGARYFEK